MRPAVFAALVACLAACKSATGPSGPTISIIEYQFTPDTLTVQAGNTVTWINNGTVNHQVASDSNSAGSTQTLPASGAPLRCASAVPRPALMRTWPRSGYAPLTALTLTSLEAPPIALVP